MNRRSRPSRVPLVAVAWLACCVVASQRAAADPIADLAAKVKPFAECLSGAATRFAIEAHVKFDDHAGVVRLHRIDDASFTLTVEHAEYGFTLERTAAATRLILPRHRTVILSRGPVDADDSLAPAGLAARLISGDAAAGPIWAGIAGDGTGLSIAAIAIGGLQLMSTDGGVWSSPKHAEARLAIDAGEIRIDSPRLKVDVRRLADDSAPPAIDTTGYTEQTVKRHEMERLIRRGVRRAIEVAAPGPSLTKPAMHDRDVPHGSLRWVEGQRLVLLAGSPDEIGKAHGQLLAKEAVACMDSTLYAIGIVDTVRTGRWFVDRLREAHERLAPHIPQRHQQEMDAMADAAGVDRATVRLANVFPELFHCSGFALFGSATSDGELYHGRVLDYMTAIGLQDAATVFIVRPDGRHAFANVGYAGFTGSVTGMNDQQISLGEMGGRGEGQWDGVPMATLMRRALEECSTLDEVKDLWARSPRTCEYYYVFADGKAPNAVGVAATPAKIEFIEPGASHEMLGEGIADAVVLSAGGRLAELRRRVIEGHGKIDEAAAVRLMDRPVAMQSNLHNALMVPRKMRLLVAQATHTAPAAEQRYVAYDLAEWFKRLPAE